MKGVYEKLYYYLIKEDCLFSYHLLPLSLDIRLFWQNYEIKKVDICIKVVCNHYIYLLFIEEKDV